MASAGKIKCAICSKSLGKHDNLELTTECGHTFHVKCVVDRLHKKKKTYCKVCRKESALDDAFKAYKEMWRTLPILNSGSIQPQKSVSCMNLREVSNNTS